MGAHAFTCIWHAVLELTQCTEGNCCGCPCLYLYLTCRSWISPMHWRQLLRVPSAFSCHVHTSEFSMLFSLSSIHGRMVPLLLLKKSLQLPWSFEILTWGLNKSVTCYLTEFKLDFVYLLKLTKTMQSEINKVSVHFLWSIAYFRGMMICTLIALGEGYMVCLVQ